MIPLCLQAKRATCLPSARVRVQSRPDDDNAACPDGPGHRQRPRAQPCLPGSHGRAATGRCCPQPRKDDDSGDCQELFLKVSVRPLCALCLCGEIVGCMVIINPLIVITKCQRNQNPAPEKLFTPARLMDGRPGAKAGQGNNR